MRVVHYLNQFFGGIGAEEQAGVGLELHNGAVGPGKVLEQLLGEGAEIVMTLVCGDNYAVEHEEELVTSVLEKVREQAPIYSPQDLASKPAAMGWRLVLSALPCSRSSAFPSSPG